MLKKLGKLKLQKKTSFSSLNSVEQNRVFDQIRKLLITSGLPDVSLVTNQEIEVSSTRGFQTPNGQAFCVHSGVEEELFSEDRRSKITILLFWNLVDIGIVEVLQQLEDLAIEMGSAAVSVVTLCQTPDLNAVTQFLDCGRRWPSSVHLWIPDNIISKMSEVVEKVASYASVAGKSSVFASVVENASTHCTDSSCGDALFPISPTSLRIQYQIQARPQLFVVDRQQLIWERGEVNTVARLRNTVERLLSGDTLIEDRLCVSDIPQDMALATSDETPTSINMSFIPAPSLLTSSIPCEWQRQSIGQRSDLLERIRIHLSVVQLAKSLAFITVFAQSCRSFSIRMGELTKETISINGCFAEKFKEDFQSLKVSVIDGQVTDCGGLCFCYESAPLPISSSNCRCCGLKFTRLAVRYVCQTCCDNSRRTAAVAFCDECVRMEEDGVCAGSHILLKLHPRANELDTLVFACGTGGRIETLASCEDVVPLTEVVSSHFNSFCDSCGDSICGVRWKCANCPDFDLCNGCFEKWESSSTGSFSVSFRAVSRHDKNPPKTTEVFDTHCRGHVFLRLKSAGTYLIRPIDEVSAVP